MIFSIIVPAYNAQATIGFTLESIIAQQNNDDFSFEIIVVNDGSSDDTLKVCESFYLLYPNLDMKIISQENAGLCAARNTGLRAARGDIIVFVDSDDALPAYALSYYHNAFKMHGDIDFAVGLMASYNLRTQKTTINKNYLKKTIGYKKASENKELFAQIFADCASACVKAVKKTFIDQHHIQMLDHVHLCEDHFYTLSLLKHAKAVYFIDNCIYYYNIGEQSSTRNWQNKYLYDMIEVQKRILNLDYDLNFYYMRFLKSWDFKKHIVEQGIIGQDKKELKEMIEPLKELLNIIPKEYQKKFMPKWYAFKDLSSKGIYKTMLKIRRNRKIKHFYKKIFIRPFQNLSNSINGVFYRKLLKHHRAQFVSFLYKLFALLPVKKAQICFVLSKFKEVHLGSIKEVLLEDKDLNVKTLAPMAATFSNDMKLVFTLARSKVIIVDQEFTPFIIPTRKQSLFVQCWHAAGLFKKFGCDFYSPKSKQYAMTKKYAKAYDAVFVSCQKAIMGYESALSLEKEQIKIMGNIATDDIISKSIPQSEAKEMLGLDPIRKLILYAPTLRDFGRVFNPMLDFKALKNTFKDYEFGLRTHPNLNLNVQDLGVYNLSDKEEWLVLCAADLLITDYSSLVFAYSYFKRPMLFYPYDYPIYLGERGFYEDYFGFIPGKVFFHQDELYELLKEIPNYSEQSEKCWQEYMSSCDGQTATRIALFIKEKMRTKK